MGSVTYTAKCPKCEGNFHKYFNCRTGESNGFCHRCGFTQYENIRRIDKSQWVREDIEYPLDGSVVFGVKSDDRLIWEKPLTEEIPGKEISAFLNAFRLRINTPDSIPDWIKPTIHLDGNHNIYHKDKNGVINQLYYLGNWFRFEKDESGKLHFYLERAIWDIGEKHGNGVLSIKTQSNVSSIYVVGEKSKDEALKMWHDLHGESGAKTGEYLTWFDPETGSLQCLCGTMPPIFDDIHSVEEDY